MATYTCNTCGKTFVAAEMDLHEHPVIPEQVWMAQVKCESCGISMLDEPDNYMCDIRVVIAQGEEGFADVKLNVCGACLMDYQKALLLLGFRDHRHGGINFLDDTSCPDGYENCERTVEPKNGTTIEVDPSWPKYDPEKDTYLNY